MPSYKETIPQLFAEIEKLAADPVIIQAVKDYNAHPDKAFDGMTNERWKTLSARDPLVRKLQENAAAQLIRKSIRSYVSEAFLSGANGGKVALLDKTSFYTHLGKPKFDEPMSGSRWEGPLELDESSGTQQVQLSVPVKDNGIPIGSLLVGIRVSRLRQPGVHVAVLSTPHTWPR